MRRASFSDRRARFYRCALVVVCLGFSNTIFALAADAPEVVIGPTLRDFGDVFAGEELEQNFPVRNNGTKPLELSLRSTLGMGPDQKELHLSTAAWRSTDLRLPRPVSAAPS